MLVRPQLEEDATNPLPRIRNAKVSSDRLEQYEKAQFPPQECKLFDFFAECREFGFKVSHKLLKTTMRAFVTKDKPPGWESFCASDRWMFNFKSRYHLSLRKRSNKKNRSVAERLPAVKEFQRTLKLWGQQGNADPKYGRFPGRMRFNVDEVRVKFQHFRVKC